MKTQTIQQAAFFELVNSFPSPHNGQPIRLKQISDSQYEAYFQKERGLQSTEISFIFSFVSIGVFMKHLVVSGASQGHGIEYELNLPQEHELKGDGLVKFADISIHWNDTSADNDLNQALIFRQTSRLKYFAGVSQSEVEKIIKIASSSGMSLHKLPAAKRRQAIWLNQRAVFDDMFDPPVKDELNHWLRYSKQEKEAKRDGLAYDCMGLNGPVMRFIINKPGILRLPVISTLLEQYYLRTMEDNSDVFYMMAPFSTPAESFKVGMVISEIWISLSLEKYYLHPFGTIMSNDSAHQDFLHLAGEDHESREHKYLVFIFRAGKSKTPIRSLRLPYEKHLLME